jgi:hypothetical protein
MLGGEVVELPRHARAGLNRDDTASAEYTRNELDPGTPARQQKLRDVPAEQ